MQSDPRLGRAPGPFGRYVFVCLGVAFATWIELIFARTHAAPFSLFAFCIAIALSAALGGLGPGLVALLLSAFAIDFFIIVPGGLLDFQTSTDALVFVAFCAGWLAYCVVSERAARRLERDRDRVLQRRARRRSSGSHRTGHRRAVARTEPGRPSSRRRCRSRCTRCKADAALMVLFGEDGGAAEIARAVGYRPEEREARESNLLGGKTPAVGRDRPWRAGGDRVAAILRGGISGAAPRRDARGVQGDRGRAAPGRQPCRGGGAVRVPSAARVHDRRPRVPRSCSARAPRRRSIDVAARVGAARARRTPRRCARARTRSWPSARTIESALRASETRYRALAARTSRHARPRRGALRGGDARKRSPAPSSSRGASPSARPPAK